MCGSRQIGSVVCTCPNASACKSSRKLTGLPRTKTGVSLPQSAGTWPDDGSCHQPDATTYHLGGSEGKTCRQVRPRVLGLAATIVAPRVRDSLLGEEIFDISKTQAEGFREVRTARRHFIPFLLSDVPLWCSIPGRSICAARGRGLYVAAAQHVRGPAPRTEGQERLLPQSATGGYPCDSAVLLLFSPPWR